jgi:hypothetical protein
LVEGGIFQPLEHFIPWGGTTCSNRWNNSVQRLSVLAVSSFSELKLNSFNSRHWKIAKGDPSKFNTQHSTFTSFLVKILLKSAIIYHIYHTSLTTQSPMYRGFVIDVTDV